MDNTSKISAIVRDEHILEVVIHELLAQSVSRADISVQGAPAKIKEKYGIGIVDEGRGIAVCKNIALAPSYNKPLLVSNI